MSGGQKHPIGNLQVVLDEAVELGMFPAAQAVVLHEGRQVFGGVAGACTGDTPFDLASLTKVMCTTAVFLKLWTKGAVGPETPLSRYFPGAPASAAGVTVADLLYHRSGLPAFVPFFADALKRHSALLKQERLASLRARVRDEVVARAAACALEAPPCTRAVYSDVGFILLGAVLEKAGGAKLDALFEEHVARPLALSARFLPPSVGAPPEGIAPTGTRRPREPAPGQEGLWPDTLPHTESRPGEVDDDNAFVLDGVAGHAGLFGTAVDVARFGQAVLAACKGDATLAPAPLWYRALATDPKVQGSTRSMGFDSPSLEGSSAGTHLGDTPPGAVGHTGFTGTSLWVDLRRSLVVALVTNRVAHGRQEGRIRLFRPVFHDLVVEALELTTPPGGATPPNT